MASRGGEGGTAPSEGAAIALHCGELASEAYYRRFRSRDAAQARYNAWQGIVDGLEDLMNPAEKP